MMASDPQSVLVLLYHDKPGNVGNPFYPHCTTNMFDG